MVAHVVGVAGHRNPPVFEENDAIAKFSDAAHIVADKQHGSSTAGDLRHLLDALALKARIADSQQKEFVPSSWDKESVKLKAQLLKAARDSSKLQAEAVVPAQ